MEGGDGIADICSLPSRPNLVHQLSCPASPVSASHVFDNDVINFTTSLASASLNQSNESDALKHASSTVQVSPASVNTTHTPVHPRLGHLIRRVKEAVLVSDQKAVNRLPATLLRVKRVWVDADFLPHQSKFYALLLNEFHSQLQQNNLKQSIEEMIGYLRIAANAVELLPDGLIAQLKLFETTDVQNLHTNFATLLHTVSPITKRRKFFNSPAPVGASSKQVECSESCLTGDFIDESGVGEAEHKDRPSPLLAVIKEIGDHSRGAKLAKKCSWVLSNKYQKIIECVEYELAQATKRRGLVRFVVVSSYTPMLEGFSRSLDSYGKIPYDVLSPETIKHILKKFGASLEPRFLLYHADSINPKHDLSTTTHVYFMNPWRSCETHRTLLDCILGKSIAGPNVLVADVVSTDSIEAEVLQICQDESPSYCYSESF